MSSKTPQDGEPGSIAASIMPDLSIVIAAHAPDAERFSTVLRAIARARQKYAECYCELIVVRNAGPEIPTEVLDNGQPLRLLEEDRLGIAWARAKGISASNGNYILFIDDDTVISEDFLVRAIGFAAEHPKVGVFGGHIKGQFKQPPPSWAIPLYGFLALRDLGETTLIVGPEEDPNFDVPGAGMMLAQSVAREFERMVVSDELQGIGRAGTSLASGDDTACCLIARRGGYSLAYFPQMRMAHLIPPTRLERGYLVKLVEGTGRSAAKLQTIFRGPQSLRLLSKHQIALRFIVHMFRHGIRAGSITAQWHRGYQSQARLEMKKAGLPAKQSHRRSTS